MKEHWTQFSTEVARKAAFRDMRANKTNPDIFNYEKKLKEYPKEEIIPINIGEYSFITLYHELYS